jgi:hypothetical protein
MITKHVSLKEKKNGKIVKNFEIGLNELFLQYFEVKEVKVINKPWYVSKKVWDNIISDSKCRGYNQAILDFRFKLYEIIRNDNVHTTKLKKRK